MTEIKCSNEAGLIDYAKSEILKIANREEEFVIKALKDNPDFFVVSLNRRTYTTYLSPTYSSNLISCTLADRFNPFITKDIMYE